MKLLNVHDCKTQNGKECPRTFGRAMAVSWHVLTVCCYRQRCRPVEALWSLPLHGQRPLLCTLSLPRGLFLCWDSEPWPPASTLLTQLHQAPGTPVKAARLSPPARTAGWRLAQVLASPHSFPPLGDSSCLWCRDEPLT